MSSHSKEIEASIKALDKSMEKIDKAIQQLYRDSKNYARLAVLAISRRFPDREIMFVCCMGCMDLYIEASPCTVRLFGEKDYQFDSTGLFQSPCWRENHKATIERMGIHSFMERLVKLESDASCNDLAGPMRLTCKGGEIIEELGDW